MLKKIYTTAFLALALVAGCKKRPGKLVGPTNAYSTSNYPASVDDLQSVLAACYSNMRDPGYLGFHYMPKALSNSIHVVNSVYNGDPSWNDMANTNVSPGNEYSTEAWTVLYTGVKNCNVLIAGAKLYNEKYGKPSDGQAVNYILGQATFARLLLFPAGVFVWRKLHERVRSRWRQNGRANLCRCAARPGFDTTATRNCKGRLDICRKRL